MLKVSGLTKSFGDRALWTDLSFQASQGDVIGLVGASGSGKTTLLNCIGALDRPSAGTISWREKDFAQASVRQRRILRRSELGYLFQNYALVESASISRNISFAVVGPWPWIRRSYSDELARVGLGGRHNDLVFRLSGGEQQRVALARIIAKRPSLILADEPTGALDDQNGHMVVQVLRDLAQEGAIVIIATHNHAVRDSCDRFIDLDNSAKLEKIT